MPGGPDGSRNHSYSVSAVYYSKIIFKKILVLLTGRFSIKATYYNIDTESAWYIVDTQEKY